MDGQEYLNQISATNRPVAKSSNSFLSSGIFKLIIGAVVALILIIIIGNVLSSGKDKIKNNLYALKLNLDNTSEVVQNYNRNIKSSALRSISVSLVTIFSNTSSELSNYFEAQSGYDETKIPSKITDEATAAKEELENDLFEAKINGILDRTYTHKMIYEVSVIMNKEAAAINSSKDTELVELLTRSYKSLENLYNNLNDFSEAK